MPIVDAGFRDNERRPASESLVLTGPTLWVEVGFNPDTAAETGLDGSHLADSDELVPALIDTGATVCSIDSALARRIGLPVVDRQTVAGVHGSAELDVYLGRIEVAALGMSWRGLFTGVEFAAGGQPHKAIVGRNFLAQCLVIYDGRRGQVTIAT